MKIRLVFVYCCLLIISTASAQIKSNENIVKGAKQFVNSSYTDIFNQHPSLNRILVEYINNEPFFITLFHRADTKSNIKNHDGGEKFELYFEGDRYYFEHKYKQTLPSLPVDGFTYLTAMKQCEGDFRINAMFTADSVFCDFIQRSPPNEKITMWHGGYRITPIFKNGSEALSDILEQGYDSGKHQIPGDSVLLFQGVVRRNGVNGTLEGIESVLKRNSPFEDYVQTKLLQHKHSWRAAIQGGRPVNSGIKIFIKLLNDGNFKILLSSGPGYWHHEKKHI